MLLGEKYADTLNVAYTSGNLSPEILQQRIFSIFVRQGYSCNCCDWTVGYSGYIVQGKFISRLSSSVPFTLWYKSMEILSCTL